MSTPPQSDIGPAEVTPYVTWQDVAELRISEDAKRLALELHNEGQLPRIHALIEKHLTRIRCMAYGLGYADGSKADLAHQEEDQL